jgi:hypothetical protein
MVCTNSRIWRGVGVLATPLEARHTERVSGQRHGTRRERARQADRGRSPLRVLGHELSLSGDVSRGEVRDLERLSLDPAERLQVLQ